MASAEHGSHRARTSHYGMPKTKLALIDSGISGEYEPLAPNP
jgi:hypothetical protein